MHTQNDVINECNCNQETKSHPRRSCHTACLRQTVPKPSATELELNEGIIDTSDVVTGRNLRKEERIPTPHIEAKVTMSDADLLPLPSAMDIDSPDEGITSIATPNDKDEQEIGDSGHTQQIPGMKDCGHDCSRGNPINGSHPAGVLIDCRKCLENLNKHSNTLLALFKITFDEQDEERSRISEIGQMATTRNLRRIAKPKESKPPATKPARPQTASSRLRVKGRFIKANQMPALQEASVEPKLEPTNGLLSSKEEEETASSTSAPSQATTATNSVEPAAIQPLSSSSFSSSSSEEEEDEETTTDDGLDASKAAFPSPQQFNDLEATTFPSADIQHEPGPVSFSVLQSESAPSEVQENNGELIITDTEDLDEQDIIPRVPTPTMTLSTQERNSRKRKLSERAKESLASQQWDEEDKSDESESTFTTETDRSETVMMPAIESANNNNAPSEDAHDELQTSPSGTSSKRRGRPPKTSNARSRKPPGRPKKQTFSVDSSLDDSHAIPNTDVGNIKNLTTTFSGPLNSSSTPFVPSIIAAPAISPPVRLLPIPKAKKSVTPPEKKRRGRPPKVPVEKSIPTTPVAIQPKPTVNTETGMTDSTLGARPQSPVVSTQETKKRGRPPKPRITLERSPVVVPIVPAGTTTVNSQNQPLRQHPLPPPTISDSTDSASSPPAPSPPPTQASSRDTISLEDSEPGTTMTPAPSASTQTRTMPFSPKKRQIHLIVRDNSKVPPRTVVPSTSDTEPYTSSDSEEEVPTVPSPKANGNKRVSSAKSSASKGAPQAKSASATAPHASLISNTSLTVRSSTSKPASIADAVLNISTDSDDSTTSEEDSEEDATFLPKRVWMSVPNGSSGGSPKTTTRGGGLVGTRGRGRGRGGTPGSNGSAPRSQGAKIEKGQQTLNFFLKPLGTSEGPEQHPVDAAGSMTGGSGVDSEEKGMVEQYDKQDIDMEDTAVAET